MRPRTSTLPLVCALLIVVSTANADVDTAKPWATGVTREQKAEAETLLEKGNQLFLDAKYLEALVAYRAAVKIYNHPKLHFNIARVLINLDRPVDAYEEIEAALLHGPEALDTLYAEARNYERLLRTQIGELEVSCSQQDVQVVVDGRQSIECPGTYVIRLVPGAHQVVARRPNFLPMTRDFNVVSGVKMPLVVQLVSLAEATITRRRWANWKPWLIVGSGVAIGGIGALFEMQARASRDEYAAALDLLCSNRPCSDEELPTSTWRRAQFEHGVGLSAIVVGSAILLTGLTFVILNRPHDALPDDALNDQRPTVVPAYSADGISLTLRGRF